jgi:hypothetical protein
MLTALVLISASRPSKVSRRRRDQTQQQCRHRRDQAHAESDDVLRLLTEVLRGQRVPEMRRS